MYFVMIRGKRLFNLHGAATCNFMPQVHDIVNSHPSSHWPYLVQYYNSSKAVMDDYLQVATVVSFLFTPIIHDGTHPHC